MFMNYASSLYVTQLAGKDNFQQLPKLIKIHFYNLASLTYSYKESHPPAVKQLPKIISDHTKNVKLYILYIDLAPSLFTIKSLLYSFKLVLEVLSFSAWVKHQKVKLSYGQKFCGMCRIPSGFKIKFFSFRIENMFFPNSLYF